MNDTCELPVAAAAECGLPAVGTLTVRDHAPRRVCEHHALSEPLHGLHDFVIYDDERCGIRHGDIDSRAACRLPIGHDGPHRG